MWGLSWKDLLLHWTFPLACLGCREDLSLPLSGPLCGRCLRRVRLLAPPHCRRCCARWDGTEDLCPACRARLSSVEVLRAAFRYQAPLVQLIHAFKFDGHMPAGRLLAGWLSFGWRLQRELGRADALVPVPLHPARERERGFNQARLLAAELSRSTRIPVVEALERARDTSHQWRHARAERAGRLLDAFRLRPGADVREKRIVLIDDVCTTGGTLEGCGRALRRSGARDVRAFVLARS